MEYFDSRIYLPKLQGIAGNKGPLLLVILHSELPVYAAASVTCLHRLLVLPGNASHTLLVALGTAGQFGLSGGRTQHKCQL